MERIRPNRRNIASREPTALIGIVRLIARQAAREWIKSGQQVDRSEPHDPLPESNHDRRGGVPPCR
jgi:hypothetical protein